MQLRVVKENSYAFMILLTIILGVLIANPYATSDIVSYSFDDGTYSHAYLIPFIMVYIAVEGARNGGLILRWRPLYVIPLIIFLAVFVWMQLAQISLIFRFFLPLVVFFALASLFRVTSAIIVFSALIWFITPIWGPLVNILQNISVFAVTEMMSWTHIPTYVEGNTVQIAVGAFEIADGCSGLRYFITSMALCLIYSFLNLTKYRNIALFTLVTIIGALVTNWIRIVVIILIGHYSEMQSPIVEDHNSLGWYIFVPFIFLLFYFGSKLEKNQPDVASKALAKSKVRPYQFTLVFLIIVGLSTSSVAIITKSAEGWAINIINQDSPAQSEQLNGLHPMVQRFQSVEKTEQNDAGMAYRFIFNGETSEQRPDYFFNNLIPEGFVQISRDNYPEFGVIEVANANNDRYVIRFDYEVAGASTASALNYKKLRLKAAAKLNRTSYLDWLIISCEKDCARLKTQLENSS